MHSNFKYFDLLIDFIEPGYYEDGLFGIRIENVLITKEAKTANNFGGTKFYGFEHITVVNTLVLLLICFLLIAPTRSQCKPS